MTRQTLAVGLYADMHGISCIVKIKGDTYHKRVGKGLTPPYTAAQIAGLVEQRASWKQELLETARRRAGKGTLAGAIHTYVRTFPQGTRRRQNAQNDLEPWIAALGTAALKSITPLMIRTQLADWSGILKPSTVNHRRQELSNLYVATNGKSGYNPTRDVKRIPDPVDEPRGFPMALAYRIIRRMRPTKARLRCLVMVTTGLPPAQIVRLESRDAHFKARTVFVRPRRKGAGVKGRTLPVTRRGALALRRLFRGGAQGAFSTSTVHRDFQAAVGLVRKAWPADQPWPCPDNLHPYDLRHCFLSEAYRKTRDLRAVAELGLHADLRTTQRYAESAVSETARKAVDLMDR